MFKFLLTFAHLTFADWGEAIQPPAFLSPGPWQEEPVFMTPPAVCIGHKSAQTTAAAGETVSPLETSRIVYEPLHSTTDVAAAEVDESPAATPHTLRHMISVSSAAFLHEAPPAPPLFPDSLTAEHDACPASTEPPPVFVSTPASIVPVPVFEPSPDLEFEAGFGTPAGPCAVATITHQPAMTPLFGGAVSSHNHAETGGGRKIPPPPVFTPPTAEDSMTSPGPSSHVPPPHHHHLPPLPVQHAPHHHHHSHHTLPTTPLGATHPPPTPMTVYAPETLNYDTPRTGAGTRLSSNDADDEDGDFTAGGAARDMLTPLPSRGVGRRTQALTPMSAGGGSGGFTPRRASFTLKRRSTKLSRNDKVAAGYFRQLLTRALRESTQQPGDGLYFNVKHEMQCDGKPVAKGSRSWKTYYVVQQGCLLWFYQHPGDTVPCGPMLLFLCASTLVENDYTKRDQVLRVRTRNDGEYLFQVWNLFF
jgi:hypothetical protein